MHREKFYQFVGSKSHFAKFVIVGSLNTGIDLALFFILADLLSINALISNILSTGLTMLLSYALNHKFVFKSTKMHKETVIQFFLATIFNIWIVQTAIIAVVLSLSSNIGFLRSHKWTLNLFAKLCGIGISFILNFVMYRYIFNMQSGSDRPVL